MDSTSECEIVVKCFIVYSGPNPVWLKQNCLLVIHGGYLWFHTNKIKMNPLQWRDVFFVFYIVFGTLVSFISFYQRIHWLMLLRVFMQEYSWLFVVFNWVVLFDYDFIWPNVLFNKVKRLFFLLKTYFCSEIKLMDFLGTTERFTLLKGNSCVYF